MSTQDEIQKLLEGRARAVGERNAKAAVSYYSDDIVNFDLAPPLAQRGREATNPAELQGWFDTWDGPIGLSFDQLEIRLDGNLAVAYGLQHMTGRRTDKTDTDVWSRVTYCLERSSDGWKIVHEHQSFPTKMDGSGKSASDLKP